jgi:glyoxylase-like metal-dependent hydrolase (beta-lactamase superfamily II)
MICKRFWTSTAFLLLLTAAFVASGRAQLETLKLIVPGVWFREGDIKRFGHCNNVLIEMKDHLIVVDANFPSGARLLIEEARRVSSKPIKYVLLTHHHGDHSYGIPLWTRLGAITVAHANVLEVMKEKEPQGWQGAAKKRKDIAELGLDKPEFPTETFDKSLRVFEDSTRRVEFHFLGWAHTKGDGLVYLPKEKVLATGDAATNGPHNFTGDASIRSWPNVLTKAMKWDIKYVLPGHGAPGGTEILAGQRKYFQVLGAAVAEGIRKGQTAEQIAEGMTLPADVMLWKGASFANQVRDAYNELHRTAQP